MKVLHYLDTVGRGGAEMQVLDVCRHASEFGIELTFVTAGGALEEEFRESGAEFVRLRRRLPIDLYLVLGLRKVIKERNIQIVHGYQPVESLHLYLAAAGIKRIKHVMSFQGFIPDEKNRLTAKILIPRMDKNIVVSESLRTWLEEEKKLNMKGNSLIIHNSADRNRLKPGGNNLRHELELADNDLIFGMIGNFYRQPRKDQLTICKSLPDVFAEVKNAHCIFAGRIEDGAREKFDECVEFCRKQGISSRVHFLGMRTDVPDILAALDVFVFSSLHEGLPVAVVEAMLSKVPLIVSDIAPLLEVTDNGKYSEVFKTGNTHELSEKIVKLLNDKDLRTDKSDAAYRYAEQKFSISVHLQNLAALYDGLLKSADS